MGGYRSGRYGWRPKAEALPKVDVREWLLPPPPCEIHQVTTLPSGRQIEVEVTWTPCGRGGHRPWWRCPRCGRRVAILYLGSPDVLGCRRCLRVTYLSTCLDPIARAEWRYCKIIKRLGGKGEFCEDIPERPNGMRRKDYERFVRQAQEALERREWAYGPRWDRLLLRLGVDLHEQ